ncbi:MAG: hypothetical protein D3904_04465 [Candidatus Electrothrix sp. EH2]|nr:hypothetical protein [Candidatus Electrothrix sp. EH2]
MVFPYDDIIRSIIALILLLDTSFQAHRSDFLSPYISFILDFFSEKMLLYRYFCEEIRKRIYSHFPQHSLLDDYAQKNAIINLYTLKKEQ